MAQAQKSTAESKRPVLQPARRRWWPGFVVLTATLAVVLTVGWGTYSFLHRANVVSEPDGLDDFESFEPLTDIADPARQESAEEEQTAPREFEGQSASRVLPAWSESQSVSADSTSGPPLGLTGHRSDAFQAGFAADLPARSDVPAWLIGTIEFDEISHGPIAPQIPAFAQPDGPSLH